MFEVRETYVLQHVVELRSRLRLAHGMPGAETLGHDGSGTGGARWATTWLQLEPDYPLGQGARTRHGQRTLTWGSPREASSPKGLVDRYFFGPEA